MNDALLDDIFEEFEDSLAPAEPERFTPSTDAEFEWAQRKRKRHIDKAEALKVHMDYELELLRKAFTRRITEQENGAAFFTEMIERGIEALEPDAKGRKAVKTVVGSIGIVTRKKYHWPADEVLVEWAEKHDEALVRVKKEPDKNGIKKYIKEHGVVPDGLEIVQTESVVIKDV